MFLLRDLLKNFFLVGFLVNNKKCLGTFRTKKFRVSTVRWWKIAAALLEIGKKLSHKSYFPEITTNIGCPINF